MKKSANLTDSLIFPGWKRRLYTGETKLFISRCMRMSATLVILVAISAQMLHAVVGMGQELNKVTVTLNDENQNLMRFFKQLEKQTSFKFVYRKSELKGITVHPTKKGDYTVAEALKLALNDAGLHYKQIEKNILITPAVRNISLKAENTPFSEIIEKVREQAGLEFYISPTVMDQTRPVSITLDQVDVRDALGAIFTDQQLAWRLVDNKVLVSPISLAPVATMNRSATAIQTTINGRVRVNINGSPTATRGVTVKIKGSDIQTLTSSDGTFSIPAEKGATLVFSMIGYQTTEVSSALVDPIDITLSPSINDLDEVVVTGYATQSRREITGSISSIRSDEISGSMTTSVDGAMQGRMSGVNVQSSVGVPGAGIRVRVRGAGSISAGNDPIYIVDGILINTTNYSTTVSTNPLATINPDDILSIEVLKDAAAASVYGAQAANGVVLITTKKGQVGAPQLNFGYRGGMVQPISILEVLNSEEYLNARFEAVRNANPTWTTQQAWTNVLNASRLDVNMTPDEIAALPTYDWQRETYRTAHTHKYDLSVAGGSEKSKYRVSGAYEDTEGSIVASLFTRGTINATYSNKITDKLELNTTINLSTINQEGPLGATGTTTQFSAPSYASPMMLPFIPIYLDDGSFNVDYGGFPGTFSRNVIHSAIYNERIERNNSLLGNLQLTYHLLPNLNYTGLVGIDYRDISSRNFYDPRTMDGYARSGILNEYTDKPISFTTTHVVNYTPTIEGLHNLNVLGGFEYRSYENQSTSAAGEGFPNHEFRQMQSAALITGASSSWTGVKRLGTFLQANYSYDQRFLASAIVRYDGSSRFGASSRFGFFPAISLGWDIAQEEFLQTADVVNQLKLRVGYGETGNDQIDNFASRSLYGGGVTYDGESGIRANSLGNARLRWERNSTTNVGVDFSLFQRRLFGTVEAYHRSSNDLLLSKPVAWAGGYSSIVENLGKVENQGVEIELGGNVIQSGSFNWYSTFNITFQDNKVSRLYDGLTVLPGDESIRVGYSMLTHVRPQYAGVNSTNGKAMWFDATGNLTYNPPTMTGDSYAPYDLPNGMPDYFGGFNNQFSYKGLTLGVFFQYDFGRVLYNNMGRTLGRKGDSQINTLKWYYENRWLEPGQITSVPRPINNAAERNSARGDLASTRYLEDASYIRLKNISLGYEIPSKYLSGINLRTASVILQANNLATWTKFSGYDPEYNTANTGVIPLTRTLNIGIQVGF